MVPLLLSHLRKSRKSHRFPLLTSLQVCVYVSSLFPVFDYKYYGRLATDIPPKMIYYDDAIISNETEQKWEGLDKLKTAWVHSSY